MTFNTYMPVRIITQENCVLKFKYHELGRRAFIMCGKSGAKSSGLLDDLTAALKEQSIDYMIYDEVTQNPQAEQCFEAGQLAREFESDFIIGAGGGSAMDAAKAAAVFAANENLKTMELFTHNIKKSMPFILIGTTAGTGSEVTPYSVLNVADDDGNQFKKSFKNSIIFAKAALCDPKYTMSLDWETTKNTALDTICHGVEALFSVRATRFDMMYGINAVKTAYAAIKTAHWQKVFENKEISFETREHLMYASILGGMAINGTGTCFPHLLGYNLTTRKGVPHGKATSCFLGEFVRRMSPHAKQRSELLQGAIGEDSIEAFLSGIENLAGEFPRLFVDELNEFTKATENMPALTAGIVSITIQDVKEIYKKTLTNLM